MTPTVRIGEPRANRRRALGLGVLAAALALLPLAAGGATLRLAAEFFHYVMLAAAWSMLAGRAGLLSLGQHAYVGLGAYLFFALTAFGGLSPWLAAGLAALGCALCALPAAAALFRLRGAYFAIGTWVAAEACRLAFAQAEVFGGGSGRTLPLEVVRAAGESRAARELAAYFFALGGAAAATGAAYALMRSRRGLALAAARDAEAAARSLGVAAGKIKLTVYALAAFFAGLAGALILLQKLRLAPDAAFHFTDWTVMVVFAVVIGGAGALEGAVLGVVVLFLLRQWLADYGSWYLIFLGALAVFVTLKFPGGLWGILRDKTGAEVFPLRRILTVRDADESAAQAAREGPPRSSPGSASAVL